MRRLLLLLVWCWSVASIASASVITYTNANVFTDATNAVPLSHTTFVVPDQIVLNQMDVTYDGVTFDVGQCASRGTPSCWIQSAGGLMSNAITAQTYSWGAGNALSALGFTVGSYGDENSYVLTATEIDGTVTQLLLSMVLPGPFFGITSTIGLRSVSLGDDPADTFASNFSMTEMWHSEIAPEGSPEPGTLALLGLGAAMLSRHRKHYGAG